MNIHSKILVHWTGKDIKDKPDDVKSQEYVRRIKDCYQKGLLLKRTSENVLRRLLIKNLLRLCFTEIKLSQTTEHAEKYGNLGIGFSRDFILNEGGRPVIYIPYEAESLLLENSLKQAYEKSKGIDDVHSPLKWVIAHVKRMKDKRMDGAFENNFDEMEWRLVFDEKSIGERLSKDKKEGEYWFTFPASEIKIVIFPDEETKIMAYDDKTLKETFSKHLPTLVTLEDCADF